MLAVSGIDHTIKIFSPDNRAQYEAKRGRNLNVHPNRFAETSLYGGFRRRRHRANREDEATERSSLRPPPPLDSEDDGPTAEADEAGNQRNAASCQNTEVGLASRRRMHDSYRIISQNDIDREGGNNETYITVSGPSFPLRPVPISFAEWIEMIQEVEATTVQGG